MRTTTSLQVNSDRLQRSLYQLAEIGQLPNGGVSRLAFTPQDLQARQLVGEWMQEAGMTLRTDAAGNLIGTYAGINPEAAALATGSHIDTVPTGGIYDGCLGVLAGIEVVRVLQAEKIRLQHPLEVIVFTDEERSIIGSKAMAGKVLPDANYYQRADGTSIQECLLLIGGDWEKIATAKRDSSQIAAFVELHVEQGGILEERGHEIGIVTGVVGQNRLAVTVVGRPNHAGTTPMNRRQDALVAASQIVLAVHRLATTTPGEQVATVGSLNVSPNAVNSVPGRVELTIDLRDLSHAHLEDLVKQLQAEVAEIATATNTKITMSEMLHILPTLSHPSIMETMVQVCQQFNLSYSQLPSRAGHDAQEIGRFTDMGMIFVPSVAGVSHAVDEYTSPQQCAVGANVLLHTLLELDRLYLV
jgi:N-carbamoyl-L-amino-acid hydrolase